MQADLVTCFKTIIHHQAGWQGVFTASFLISRNGSSTSHERAVSRTLQGYNEIEDDAPWRKELSLGARRWNQSYARTS